MVSCVKCIGQIDDIYFSDVLMNTASLVFTGVYSLPPICLGYLIGGFIMKKFKITVKKAAYLAFCLSVFEYLLFLCHFMLTCDNAAVAGLTTSYKGYVVS